MRVILLALALAGIPGLVSAEGDPPPSEATAQQIEECRRGNFPDHSMIQSVKLVSVDRTGFERVLEADSRVLECCVVPIADTVKGHLPVAFVVPGSADVTEEAIRDIALAGAPAYMHPRRVFFLDAMPLAGTNKIDRRALIERAEALSAP